MKPPKNLSWIRMLMIISQLVLTGFVVQWLVSQYNTEREDLKNELSRQFMEAQEEVMDSMLVVHLIDPIMQGNESYTVELDISGDSLEFPFPGDKGCLDTPVMRHVRGKTAVIAMKSTDSLPVNMADVYATTTSPDKIEDVMLKSVRLIVERAADPLHPDSGFARIMTSMLDTGLLKRTFEKKLNGVEESLFALWHDSLSMDEAKGKKASIYFICAFPGQACGVEIRNYFWHLARKTAPSFLFGLVLLLLTGGSFIIAFRALKKQMILNRMRNNFVSNISHELKTPVSTVKVALEALRGSDLKKDPTKAEEYLVMAEKELNRLDLLISKVLNASLYDNGVKIIETEPVDLVELAEEVMELFKPRFVRDGATVNLEAGGEPCIVPADKLHLQGVLVNLLDNSLKYGGSKPLISLRLTCTDQCAVIAVSDNGPGIPSEYLEKVFDKFFRVPAGDRHNIKGYGLGLSYAAMVMEQHGGTIKAENIPEGGITFTLTFPGKLK